MNRYRVRVYETHTRWLEKVFAADSVAEARALAKAEAWAVEGGWEEPVLYPTYTNADVACISKLDD